MWTPARLRKAAAGWRALVVFGALVLFPAAPVLGQGGGTPSSGAEVSAFVGVNVIPMDREWVLRDQTVVVRGDRIVEVGPRNRVRIPAGARRIDGSGKYLIPGLAEMHGHLPSPRSSPEYAETVLFLYVANGVTTVRGMQGADGQIELRERVNRGEVIGPTLYVAGPGFTGQTARTPEQAIQRVRQQKAEGWDLLKILPGIPRDAYDAIVRTAREVGIPFAGHVPADVGIIHALEVKQATIDHLDGMIEYLGGDRGPLDPARTAELARRTREAGVPVVPTMAVWEVLIGAIPLDSLRGYPELRYLPRNVVDSWIRAKERQFSDPNFDAARARRIAENRIQLLRALHEAGVQILFGTDSPQQFSVPGFSIHREFPLMRAAGMTPYQILESATRNVGEHFRDKDRFGTIAPGMRADLVLLEANPLEDISNVRRVAGVMTRGRWLSAEDIRARLERIQTASS